MTHESYFDQSGEGNSRWVFKGMFSFRGKVADVLVDWIPGRGQMLQHILGLHFSNSRLHSLFDDLHMQHWIRCGSDFVVAKHRHIFVYGWLGWLSEKLPVQRLEHFITTHFLDDEIIRKTTTKKMQTWDMLRYLCQKKYHKKPTKLLTVDHAYHTVTILVENDVVAAHTSKSATYAQRKAIEKALKKLADEDHGALYPFLTAKREQVRQWAREKKERKHQDFLLKNALKKQQRAERKKRLKAENEAKNNQRQLAKKKVKKAKERKKEQKVKITTGMNSAKRRCLEDK